MDTLSELGRAFPYRVDYAVSLPLSSLIHLSRVAFLSRIHVHQDAVYQFCGSEHCPLNSFICLLTHNHIIFKLLVTASNPELLAKKGICSFQFSWRHSEFSSEHNSRLVDFIFRARPGRDEKEYCGDLHSRYACHLEKLLRANGLDPIRMEKGKAKGSGSQGKGSKTKLQGDPDILAIYSSQNAPQMVSQDEKANNQLSAYQDSSGRREGRSLFGSDMFDDPFFKDPFFTRPFGEPFKSSGLFGPEGAFDHGIFDMGRKLIDQFQFNNPPSVFQNGRIVAPIEGHRGGGGRNVQIEELSHDGGGGSTRGSNQVPIIEHPDDDHSRGSFHERQRSPNLGALQKGGPLQPAGEQRNSYTFYSSSVMQGGSNGPIYASQTTRRQGPNGVIEEEHQEKDSTSGKAHHRVSHGLYDKGHSLIRERKKDGQEERFETLHNLAQEEVPQFEDEWGRVAEKNLPKWPSSSSPQLGPNSRSRSRPALPPGGTSRKTPH